MSNYKQTSARLRRLRNVQMQLGRQLEKAYLHNRMTDYLVMEKRQQRIALIIDKLLGQLDEKARSSLGRTQSGSFL